ncbi:MFS-type transporter clz9-like isoform X2 [Polistes fuscatus]|uniref:MFS-type transporter clz9-like isoform X2 n=1 Tax=Polistes fuscatus TaxID=30207 RepID=UPI001CA9CBCD|nr:MFS-type transporter clz9-like isoform X2 [Polistes fuscatus]
MDFLWLNGFLNRHPELSKRIAQNLTACRASISEFSIKKWFSEVEIELKQKSLLNIESNRVFNGDESAFMLAPKSDKVFVKKAGDLAPPLVVFSYKRVPNNIRENMPHDWAAGKSDNGWMNGENFFEYIANIFYPWLIDNKIKFPVVLYIDGHSSHLTMTVSEFCREKQIVLVALHPNATHILQPLDVSFFHPLKLAWRTVVTDWRMKNNGQKITKEAFASLLKTAVDTLDTRTILGNGFKTTGLFPFSANAINYTKLRNKSTEATNIDEIEAPKDDNRRLLSLFESLMDPNTLKKFTEAQWPNEGTCVAKRGRKLAKNRDIANLCFF